MALNIFVHIPKTAGEVFKRNIESSFSKDEFIRTSFEYQESYYDIQSEKYSFYRNKEHFIQYIHSLNNEQIKKIRCIGGHNSYYGIHNFFKSAPQNPPTIQYISFFREPIARTLSLYNYERMAFEFYSKKKGVLNPLEISFLKRMENNFIIDGKIPEFEAWLENIYNKKTPFYFTMTQYLRHLNFLVEPTSQRSLEQALEKFYFIGITEKHEEDTLFLYHQLKVKKFIADRNSSIPFISIKDLKPSVVSKIKEQNIEDELLYHIALKKNVEFKKNFPTFQILIEKMHKKKRRANFLELNKQFVIKAGKSFFQFIKTGIKLGLNKCHLAYIRPSKAERSSLGANLRNTDERYVPWSKDLCTGYEHIHRYDFAAKYVKEKKVLDLACGEGYGSYLLSKSAKEVIGIDVSLEAIQHARNAYKASNLSFVEADMKKIPFSNSFDVIVCFEALEHIYEQTQLLKEVIKALKEKGILIISTPNKTLYSNQGRNQNKYHLKELEFHEFENLLKSFFKYTAFYGQKSYIASKLFSLNPSPNIAIEERIIQLDDYTFSYSQSPDPLPRYYIGIASNHHLENLDVHSYLIDTSTRNGYIKWMEN